MVKVPNEALTEFTLVALQWWLLQCLKCFGRHSSGLRISFDLIWARALNCQMGR